MKIDELIKKPIEVVVENNISDDMIFPDTSIYDLIAKIRSKLHSENFLLVYVDSKENKQIRSVIMSSDLDSLINLITETESKNVDGLNLESLYTIKYIVEVSQPIESALNAFSTEKTDIVVVKSSEGKYLGKIQKNKLKEWFSIMINN